MTDDANRSPDTRAPLTGGMLAASIALRVVIVLAIVLVGAGVGFYWMKNRPVAQRKPPAKQARLVEVRAVTRAEHRVVVRAMGTVEPAQEIDLAAQVSGRVIDVNPRFVPGGRFAAGERIVQIDPTDYRLALAQRQAELARAKADLAVEMGRQDVARREYELLGKEIREEDRDLVLRVPQLEQARAAVASAEAAVAKAQLDLERTDVAAPFAATVKSRHCDLGSQIAAGTPLAAVCGTDAYWIRVLVPVDDLAWIDVPGFNAEAGAAVRVYQQRAWGAEAFREGRVLRLATELEPRGRMAMLLVTVEDPLHLEVPAPDRRPLILDAYLRVEIEGRAGGDAVRLARTSLRGGNQVWVMTPEKTLEVRPVEVVWGDVETVLVSDGLAGGDLVITSDLGSPVAGMPLRTAEDAADTLQKFEEPEPLTSPHARKEQP